MRHQHQRRPYFCPSYYRLYTIFGTVSKGATWNHSLYFSVTEHRIIMLSGLFWNGFP